MFVKHRLDFFLCILSSLTYLPGETCFH
jgi:hypothetical protein